MSKVAFKGKDIPVDQLKPSPYQPRMAFDLDDIKGSIMRDGILVALTIREKDGDYELVDGERRWRLAKELGYETVPCDIIDIDDDTARRMVWKVNTLRKDYEPNEKAHFFKKMQEPPYGMSLKGIAREYDQDAHTVKAYLNVFKLPDDYQQMVWDRIIPLGVIRELEVLFNGVEYSTPKENPEIFSILDRARKEKGFDFMQARRTLKPYLAKLREEQVEKAKEALEKVEPEVKPPETPEELEEAAKALREEAKRRKSPEQILEEKRDKARSALLTGRGNAQSKIEKAQELGIGISGFEERFTEIEAKIHDSPDEAYEEAKKLKGDVNEAIKDFEEKQKEAEIREKVEKAAKKEAEKELLEDEEFRKKAVEKQRIEEARKVVGGISKGIELPPEAEKKFKESMKDYQESLEKLLTNPVVQKRGELFRNWFGHSKILGFTDLVACPICGNTELSWNCHHLTLEEACDMLQEKYEKTYKESV